MHKKSRPSMRTNKMDPDSSGRSPSKFWIEFWNASAHNYKLPRDNLNFVRYDEAFNSTLDDKGHPLPNLSRLTEHNLSNGFILGSRLLKTKMTTCPDKITLVLLNNSNSLSHGNYLRTASRINPSQVCCQVYVWFTRMLVSGQPLMI